MASQVAPTACSATADDDRNGAKSRNRPNSGETSLLRIAADAAIPIRNRPPSPAAAPSIASLPAFVPPQLRSRRRKNQ
ncbi:hypothetical protein Apmu_0176_02 [Acidiphilium multivorum AIU301]|nr:hypothetical protein Apmu_0176_02 [Acidiphilium multivorum AIU301]